LPSTSIASKLQVCEPWASGAAGVQLPSLPLATATGEPSSVTDTRARHVASAAVQSSVGVVSIVQLPSAGAASEPVGAVVSVANAVGNAAPALVKFASKSSARTPSECAPSASAGGVHVVPGAGTDASLLPMPSTYTS
jgi:hypothetical protein